MIMKQSPIVTQAQGVPGPMARRTLVLGSSVEWVQLILLRAAASWVDSSSNRDLAVSGYIGPSDSFAGSFSWYSLWQKRQHLPASVFGAKTA